MIASEIIPIIRRVAAAAGATVIDVNGAFNPDPKKYFGAGNGTDIGDGIHPNNAGAMAIARAVAARLTESAPDAGADARLPDDAGADTGNDTGAPVPDASSDTEPAPLEKDAGVTVPDARLLRDSGVDRASAPQPEEDTGSAPPRAAAKGGGCALGGRPSGAALLLVVLAQVLRRRRRH